MCIFVYLTITNEKAGVYEGMSCCVKVKFKVKNGGKL
jgi:hypothetical protein